MEKATLTKPQPASQPYLRLVELLLLVLARYRRRGLPLPPAIVVMLPCVADALRSGDETYMSIQYEYFKCVVASCVLHRHAWEADQC